MQALRTPLHRHCTPICGCLVATSRPKLRCRCASRPFAHSLPSASVLHACNFGRAACARLPRSLAVNASSDHEAIVIGEKRRAWPSPAAFEQLSEEEVSAAAKALDIELSGSKSALIHQIVDRLQPSLQQMDQVQQQLERLTNAVLLKQCEYLGLSLKKRPGKKLLVSSLIDVISEHQTTSAGSQMKPHVNKPLSSQTVSSAKVQKQAKVYQVSADPDQVLQEPSEDAASMAEQVTTRQMGSAVEGQAEGSDGQHNDAQKANSAERHQRMNEPLTPAEEVLAQIQTLGYEGLMKQKKDSLCQDSHALGLPGYGKKAELATALMEAAKEAGRQGNAKEQKQAKVYQVSEEPGQVLEEPSEGLMPMAEQPKKKVMSKGHAVEVMPEPIERDANVKDTGIPTEGAGDQPMRRRQRVSPVQQDMEEIGEDGPVGDLGIDLPEMNPRSARSAVADNAADVDTDVVARQRLTDKQSAVLPEEDEEDGDLSDVRMDEALMLDQEPSPEYDLDDEQRPRLSRNADGDLTEANFGNDDETLGRLEDMGVSGGDEVGTDVSVQNAGSAQRRRQASRVNAAEIPEDEDDQFGSMAIEATSRDSDGDSEPEEGELPINATQGYGLESYDGLEDPAGSGDYLNTAELADGFQTSDSSAAGMPLDDEEAEFGDGMTNEQYGKARQLEKMSQQMQEGQDIAEPKAPAPKPRGKQGRPPKQKPLAPTIDPTPTLTLTSASPDDSSIPTSRSGPVMTDAAMSRPGPDMAMDPNSEASSKLAMPDWLANKYNSSSSASFDPNATSTTPLTRMAASSFKPVRRKKKKTVPVADDSLVGSLASDAATGGQTAAADTSMSATASAKEAEALEDESLLAKKQNSPQNPAPLEAALKDDAQLTNQAVDEAAATLSPEAIGAIDTMLSAETDPTVAQVPGTDPYSQAQSTAALGGQTLEAGDLSPEEVDSDPSLTPEADAVINAGVASVVPTVSASEASWGQGRSGVSDPPSIISDELSDANVSTESFAGAVEMADKDQSTLQGVKQDSSLQEQAGTSLKAARTDGVAAEQGRMTDAEDVNTSLPAQNLSGDLSVSAQTAEEALLDAAQLQQRTDLTDDLAASEAAVDRALAAAADSLSRSKLSPAGDIAAAERGSQSLSAQIANHALLDATQPPQSNQLTDDLVASEAAIDSALAAAADSLSSSSPLTADSAIAEEGQSLSEQIPDSASAGESRSFLEQLTDIASAEEGRSLLEQMADSGSAGEGQPVLEQLVDIASGPEGQSLLEQIADSTSAEESGSLVEQMFDTASAEEDQALLAQMADNASAAEDQSFLEQMADVALAAEGQSLLEEMADSPSPKEGRTFSEQMADVASAAENRSLLEQVAGSAAAEEGQALLEQMADNASVEAGQALSEQTADSASAADNESVSEQMASDSASAEESQSLLEQMADVALAVEAQKMLAQKAAEDKLFLKQMAKSPLAEEDLLLLRQMSESPLAEEDLLLSKQMSNSPLAEKDQLYFNQMADSASAEAGQDLLEQITDSAAAEDSESLLAQMADSTLQEAAQQQPSSELVDDLLSLEAAAAAGREVAAAQNQAVAEGASRAAQENLAAAAAAANQDLMAAPAPVSEAVESGESAARAAAVSTASSNALSSVMAGAPTGLSEAAAEDITAAVVEESSQAEPALTPLGDSTLPGPTTDSEVEDITAATTQDFHQSECAFNSLGDSSLPGPTTDSEVEDIAAPAINEPFQSHFPQARSYAEIKASGDLDFEDAFSLGSTSGSPPLSPPPELRQELASDLRELQALRSQVAEKQAALVALETQLGSTNASAAQNRDQIQKLQMQMTELQDQHVAWQQTMLTGRLQELRAAAARVENNQALKVDLQQQVQGMGDQLASLEASLKASDAQAGSLRQELASSGNGPPVFKVNGRELNGSTSANLPKGYYYTLADLAPAGKAAQEAAPQPQSAESVSSPRAAGPQAGIGSSSSGQVQSTDISRQDQGLSTEQEQKLEEALLVGEGSEAVASGNTSQSRAVQPGVAVTLGVIRAAEVGKATVNFFSGLLAGNKGKPPTT